MPPFARAFRKVSSGQSYWIRASCTEVLTHPALQPLADIRNTFTQRRRSNRDRPKKQQSHLELQQTSSPSVTLSTFAECWDCQDTYTGLSEANPAPDSADSERDEAQYIVDALRHASLLPAIETIEEAPDEGLTEEREMYRDGNTIASSNFSSPISPISPILEPLTPPRASPSATTSASTSPRPTRPLSQEGEHHTTEAPAACWKGQGRCETPVLVETCPTPDATRRRQPSSRQRSLLDHSAASFFNMWPEDECVNLGQAGSDFESNSNVGGSQRSDFSCDGEERHEEDDGSCFEEEEDPAAWDAYRRRPATPLNPRFSLPQDPDALPYPASPSIISDPSEDNLYHFTEYRPVATPPGANPFVRAKLSRATLFTHDLAHLPAPATPREQPYRVAWTELLVPSWLLRSGRGSGRFGDRWGPVERRVPTESSREEEPMSRRRRSRRRWSWMGDRQYDAGYDDADADNSSGVQDESMPKRESLVRRISRRFRSTDVSSGTGRRLSVDQRDLRRHSMPGSKRRHDAALQPEELDEWTTVVVV